MSTTKSPRQKLIWDTTYAAAYVDIRRQHPNFRQATIAREARKIADEAVYEFQVWNEDDE